MGKVGPMWIQFMGSCASQGGPVVRVLRCDRNIPGSNRGQDKRLFAKRMFGRRSTKTDHRKATDASQIQKKVTEKSSTTLRSTEIQHVVEGIR